jgi:primosomal replication protein N''
MRASTIVPGVRKCPRCGNERPGTELFCEQFFPGDGRECGYDLLDVPIGAPGARAHGPIEADPVETRAPMVCANGHEVEEGDQICTVCGSDVAPFERSSGTDSASIATPGTGPSTPSDGPILEPTVIDGWRTIERLPPPENAPLEQLVVEPEAGGARALLTLYNEGCEPDTAVYAVLRRMPRDHVPELLATGRYEGRAFDVVELVAGGSLADAGRIRESGPELVRTLAKQIGAALADFAEAGLRHRDLGPKTILLRQADPIDLVITGFGSARLSDLDLEAVAPLKPSRYSAPEAIVGAVSAASDWWSLGMVVLECATRGACFDGVNDQAFLIHVVTRGMELPPDLSPETLLLLRGLLARDPLVRWSWPQVRAWLSGEPLEAPAGTGPGADDGPPITLAGRDYRHPESFAIAAAEAANWAEARSLTLRGGLARWLEERNGKPQVIAEVRRIVADDELPEDHRHALALMAAARDLPLVLLGEIVTPAWLLVDPDRGYDLVTGSVTRHLERIERETWLVRLRNRIEPVRERARLLEIELDEARARVALLATSRANLEAERDRLRILFPDTEHNGLASLMERNRKADEDLIILVSAAVSQFVPLLPLIEASHELATATGVHADRNALRQMLSQPRREIFMAVDERTANFARCGVARIDEWADRFRVERRMPLPRAAVLLSAPKERWREPPKQQYVLNLLEHFEKRVSGTVGRGPLVRFSIGKSTARVDLMELGSPGRSAESLVNHLIGRTDVPITLDPSGYMADEQIAGRLRRLVNQALTFRRDTGIDGRYLGFPFLAMCETRSAETRTRPRIAPALLWPVVIEMPPGWGQGARIAFDREREDVRLNPALEGIVGTEEFMRWKAARDEVLARGDIKVPDVLDRLAHLATPPRERSLRRVPGADIRLSPGAKEIVPAAALFNVDFTGQAVAEDLRQIKAKPLSGTALEVTLRVAEAAPAEPPQTPERDRYCLVESDPSQDEAVRRSRLAPGIVVEGPPGTGKSQTIVNVVATAIGHGETVLVVCQKQAALQVVKKRLEADGLGDRLFAVTHINKDRTEIVTALRTQLDTVRSVPRGWADGLRRQREENAGRIEALEQEIDRNHAALTALDDVTGLSYKAAISELVGLETAGPSIPMPRLRQVVGRLGIGELSTVEESCGPLARIWLPSNYEGSALSAFRPFAVEDGTAELIGADLTALIESESHRRALEVRAAPGYETDAPEALRAWLAREAAVLEALDDDIRPKLVDWLELFRPSPGGACVGDALAAELSGIVTELGSVIGSGQDANLAEALGAKTDNALASAVADLDAWAITPSLFVRMKPARLRMRRRVRALTNAIGVELVAEGSVPRLRAAIAYELALRPFRNRLGNVRTALRRTPLPVALDLPALRSLATELRTEALGAQQAARAVLACPAPELAAAAARMATRSACVALRERLEAACIRHEARKAVLDALDLLSEWLRAEVIQEWRTRIAQGGKS